MNEEIRKVEMLHQHSARTAASDRKALKSAKARLRTALAAQSLMQEAARAIQDRAHAQMCGLVTKCLKTVFGDEAYEFKIVFEKKRGKTDARLVFVRGREEWDPTTESGFGQIEVANFAMDLARVMMTGRRKLMVADEPWKNVNGKDNRERLAALLPVLCEELGFQFLIATGLEWLRGSGKCVEISKT